MVLCCTKPEEELPGDRQLEPYVANCLRTPACEHARRGLHAKHEPPEWVRVMDGVPGSCDDVLEAIQPDLEFLKVESPVGGWHRGAVEKQGTVIRHDGGEAAKMALPMGLFPVSRAKDTV